MARIRYHYDPETCKYEAVKKTPLQIVVSGLGLLALSFLVTLAFIPIYNTWFRSEREARLQKENEELKLYYDLLGKEMQEANAALAALQERDDKVYRVIFEAEPIAESVRGAGVGGAERYKDLLNKGLAREELILTTTRKLDQLKKQMYIQTKSYDEIARLVKNKAQMLASIPAIQPIANKHLRALASGYGWRIHPIYKVRKMHTGIDFSAARGTPIYATGDGVVTLAESNYGGYGREVQITHGYGYLTLYAHMERFVVRQGQKIKRGELIGYVGSTGTSVAPHLHYEVIYNGVKVNPIHFFFNDLTPAEYNELLKLASVENQSLS